MLAGSAVLLSGDLTASASSAAGQSQNDHPAWANTWMAAVTHGDATGSTNAGLNDQSVRLIVHTTVSGAAVRIRLTNSHGDHSITVGHATVAKPDDSTAAASDIDPSTLHELQFNGASSAVVQKGDTLLSDPVQMPVGRQSDLVVTVYFPTPTGPTTFHSTSRQTNFVGPTDLADAISGSGFTITRTCCWFFLSGVDVLRGPTTGPVVVFGDSIGDANGSTLNANTRWPNLLYDRLVHRQGNDAPAVLNASLAGNRLNHEGSEPGAGGFPGFNELGSNAIARLNDDVFAEINPQTVITDLGINDIWMSDDSASAIIATLRQLNTQLQEHGLRSLVATLGPYEHNGGVGVWTPEKEATRQAVNAWIRGNQDFDGVIDFDAVLADPADPAELLPAYDSGDHIHPNDLGNQAMADAVPLDLLDR
ncbi:MAG: SGNH/GDSL hydrolase family protein [Jatrophihabitantaceae bacterium]